ncbi:MAG: hypothetical protein [Arizlama microvirus]|nr:MAG: hypothetical protein [Arizlama microvirus]
MPSGEDTFCLHPTVISLMITVLGDTTVTVIHRPGEGDNHGT